MINQQRFLREEITTGKLLELETCPQNLIGGFAIIIDELRIELCHAVVLLDTKYTNVDGSNADTLKAHVLLAKITPKEENE